MGALLVGTFALAGLSACSAIKIGYNNLPELSYWWLDGYVDFDGAPTKGRAEINLRLVAGPDKRKALIAPASARSSTSW